MKDEGAFYKIAVEDAKKYCCRCGLDKSNLDKWSDDN